jgi:phosphoribosyl-AMP cyclohydrolase
MLVPIVAIRGGEAFTFEGGPAVTVDDLSAVRKLGYLGLVTLVLDEAAITAGPTDPLLAAILNLVPCSVGPLPTSDEKAVISWLDKGARTVFFQDPEMSELYALSQLPQERLTAKFTWTQEADGKPSTQLLKSITDSTKIVGTIVVDASVAAASVFASDAGLNEAMLAQLVEVCAGAKLALDAGSTGCVSADQVAELHKNYKKYNYTDVHAQSFVAEEASACPDKCIDVAQAFTGCLRSDRPDGLFTTVVADETGKALGLVYSNAESIRAAIYAGRGVYWSRSRGGLWRKGDTSGAWQDLWGLSIDCDSDALLFTVHQHGRPIRTLSYVSSHHTLALLLTHRQTSSILPPQHIHLLGTQDSGSWWYS